MEIDILATCGVLSYWTGERARSRVQYDKSAEMAKLIITGIEIMESV